MHTYLNVHTFPPTYVHVYTYITHASLMVALDWHICFISRTSFLRFAPTCKTHFLLTCEPQTTLDLHS